MPTSFSTRGVPVGIFLSHDCGSPVFLRFSEVCQNDGPIYYRDILRAAGKPEGDIAAIERGD